jgi:transmembrane sensor
MSMTDEMYSLLGRYFAGQASAEEVVAVEKWVAESDANKNAFAEVEQLWKQGDTDEVIAFDSNKAWDKVHAALQQTQQPTAKVVRFPLWKKITAAAAVLVLIAAGWWLFNGMNKNESIIADTDLKEVTLEDGSHVWLRKGSRLDHVNRFEKDNRIIEFSGEAFFDIAKDAAHPFVINGGGAAVKVLGTSFTVNTNDNKTEVIVKTGTVSLASLADSNKKVILTPDEKGVWENGQVNKILNEDVNFDSWQTGNLLFENMPVPKVISTLNKHFMVNIRIRNEDKAKLSGVHFTADFSNEKLEKILEVLQLTGPIRVLKISAGVYEVSSVK